MCGRNENAGALLVGLRPFGVRWLEMADEKFAVQDRKTT